MRTKEEIEAVLQEYKSKITSYYSEIIRGCDVNTDVFRNLESASVVVKTLTWVLKEEEVVSKPKTIVSKPTEDSNLEDMLFNHIKISAKLEDAICRYLGMISLKNQKVHLLKRIRKEDFPKMRGVGRKTTKELFDLMDKFDID